MKYSKIIEVRETPRLEGINALLAMEDSKWIYLGWERVQKVEWLGLLDEKKPVLRYKITHIVGRIK